MQTLDIGFVGLSVMGTPMATHLARAGHRLRLHDVRPGVAAALAQALGGPAQAFDSPAALAAGCE
nr:NAD(P)-binding domain-containing protein [Burkholderiaceae bacterium]